MIKILTKVEVEDFAKWKVGFMANESVRKAAGSTGSQVFQNTDNPKSVVAITEWDNLEKAKAFSASPALREAQQKAGVQSKSEAYVLESL
jgi:heme-degrading monooxygenase HmoA